MRRLPVIAALLLLAPFLNGQDDASSPRERLLERMEEYLQAMDALQIPYAEQEVDYMISSVSDSTLRSAVASRAYSHFRYSKVMGSENVAVHIYDRWFATFETVFGNIEDLDEAGFHAFINRRSLIGEKAACLSMTDMQGSPLTFPFPNGRRSIIYFYSTSCVKCRYTSARLRSLMRELDPDVDFFAVYTGGDSEAWQSYVAENLTFESSNSAVYHLAGGEDDFVTAYGVIQTPRLFLVDGEGRIIGRNLDAEALSRLL